MASPSASVLRSAAGRGVHIQVFPRPMNIGESRAVLNLLSQFGEVEYYRNLRYDAKSLPNSALAIFRDDSAARSCILRSPLRFRLGAARTDHEPAQSSEPSEFDSAIDRSATPSSQPRAPAASKPWDLNPSSSGASPAHRGPFGMGQTRSLNTDSLPRPPRAPPTYPFHLRGMPEPSPSPEQSAESQEQAPRIYQMYINASSTDFLQRAEMGHYHGGFTNDWRSAVNDDLRKRTPLKGMANLNWRMKTKSASTIRQERAAILAQGQIGGLGDIYRQAQGNATEDEG